MSPILVRPVREQLEHDRIIRLLQAKFRRRFDVGMNPGAEQNAPIGTGPTAMYPDLVLTAEEHGKKAVTIVEVETVESVNNLEALAEWVTFGRLRPQLHLYIPAQMIEVAKRLCADHHVAVAEIHSYHLVGDEFRFVSVFRAPVEARGSGSAAPRKPPASKLSNGGIKAAASKVKPAKPARLAKVAKSAKPVKTTARRPAKPTRKASPARAPKRK